MYDKHSFIWYITFTAPKGNSNFQILLAKIFNHEKANQILPATKKVKFFLLKKRQSHVPPDYNFNFCKKVEISN